MFRAFTMPVIRSILLHRDGWQCDVTANHPGQPYRTLHLTSPHSYVVPAAAYAVMHSDYGHGEGPKHVEFLK
jgi:hypothetical protein